MTRLVLWGLLSALLAAPASASPKRVGILVFDGVLTGDVTAPAEVVGMAIRISKRSDWVVKLISAHPRPQVTTHEGLRLVVDEHVADAPDVDVLIVAGSYDSDAVLRLPGVADFLGRQVKAADYVASNCAGAFLVASTGAYDGRTVTTYATGAKALREKFPKVNAVEGSRVVVDGRLVTSNGGVVSYESALVLVALLFGADVAKEVHVAVQMDQIMPLSGMLALAASADRTPSAFQSKGAARVP